MFDSLDYLFVKIIYELKSTIILIKICHAHPGFKSYLSIALSNKYRDVALKTVEIRDLKNNVIEELPVILINGDNQFYTTDPFHPPTEPFRIAVREALFTKLLMYIYIRSP